MAEYIYVGKESLEVLVSAIAEQRLKSIGLTPKNAPPVFMAWARS